MATTPPPSEVWRWGDEQLASAALASEAVLRREYAWMVALVAEAERRDLGRRLGYAGTTGWMREELRLSAREIRTRLGLAAATRPEQSLTGPPRPARLAATGTALATAEISAEHARVIAETFDRRPSHVTDEARSADERTLLELAAQATPDVVRVAARRLITYWEADGRPPEDEELAAPRREFAYHHTRPGEMRFHGLLDPETAATLEGLFGPLAKPQPTADGSRDGRGREARQGDALAEIIDCAARTDDLTVQGGERAVLTTTLSLTDLEHRTRQALLTPPEQARTSHPAIAARPPEPDDPGGPSTWHRRTAPAETPMATPPTAATPRSTGPVSEAEPSQPSHEPAPFQPTGEPGSPRPASRLGSPHPAAQPAPFQPATEPAPFQSAGKPMPTRTASKPTPFRPAGESAPCHPPSGPGPCRPADQAEPTHPAGEPEQHRPTSRLAPPRSPHEPGPSHPTADPVPFPSPDEPEPSRTIGGPQACSQPAAGTCPDHPGRVVPGLLGVASLDQLRRLACEAAVVPAIYGQRGEPLYLGRTTRHATTAQRRALALRDRGCAFPGCTRTPKWTVPHHLRPWAHGGTTDIDNLVLLCAAHHRVIHHTRWEVRIDPSSPHPEFLPRHGSTPTAHHYVTPPTTPPAPSEPRPLRRPPTPGQRTPASTPGATPEEVPPRTASPRRGCVERDRSRPTAPSGMPGRGFTGR
ncbi:HNH endonuclease [Amycolatopsis arida]|uniref:HNH endonuclease n=2 Tax=Amycolatopsis arida TaxID=587909 RepID=A0A1I5LIV1_9PSEU|nr:HNH endonuclease [Amycolatopsis arida]SFO96671.1 HNH endonuclease [Amycolatopsis arida]